MYYKHLFLSSFPKDNAEQEWKYTRAIAIMDLESGRVFPLPFGWLCVLLGALFDRVSSRIFKYKVSALYGIIITYTRRIGLLGIARDWHKAERYEEWRDYRKGPTSRLAANSRGEEQKPLH